MYQIRRTLQHTNRSSLLVLLLLAFTQMAYSSPSCPWEDLRGSDFFHLDIQLDKEKALTVRQLQEDLACLHILLANVYSYDEINNDHLILKRLADLYSSVQPMSNSEFVQQIFSLHAGFIDTHLSYEGGGTERHFASNSIFRVELNENLEEGRMVDKGRFVYFKSGNVPPFLSKGQAEFVHYVREHDRNLVIDLRGNGGGSDDFAHALAEALFTPAERLPKTTRRQVNSPLSNIGLCLSLAISYGPEMGGAKDQCEKYRTYFADVQFPSLLNRSIESEMRTLQGKRDSQYTSRIYLITDSTCASSCETIVEKLSMHSRVVTIGQPTYGALHFSNAGTFVLPNSEVLVKIPTLFQAYESDAKEGVGYVPSIVTDRIDLRSLKF